MFQNSKVGFPRELTRIEVLLEQEEAEVEKPIQWMHPTHSTNDPS